MSFQQQKTNNNSSARGGYGGGGSRGRGGRGNNNGNKGGGGSGGDSPNSNMPQQNFQNLFIAKVPDHIRQEDVMAVFVEGLKRVNERNGHKQQLADPSAGGAAPATASASAAAKDASAASQQPFIPNPQSAMVSLDPATGVSKGFGFALFPDNDCGAAAQKALNNCTVMYNHVSKKVLSIEFAGEASKDGKGKVDGKKPAGKGKASEGTITDGGITIHPWRLVLTGSRFDGATAAAASPCLYVRNVPLTLSQAEVSEMLSAYGKVEFCAVRHDHLQRPIWVVFVEYDCTASAQRALTALHGNHSIFPEAAAPILAKFADTQEQREQRKLMRGGPGTSMANGTTGSGVPIQHQQQDGVRPNFHHNANANHHGPFGLQHHQPPPLIINGQQHQPHHFGGYDHHAMSHQQQQHMNGGGGSGVNGDNRNIEVMNGSMSSLPDTHQQQQPPHPQHQNSNSGPVPPPVPAGQLPSDTIGIGMPNPTQ